MGLAVFYDPCFSCEHRDTKKMCNMCEITYYRHQHESKTAKELNPKLYDSFDWETIHKKLEEQDEQGTSKT